MLTRDPVWSTNTQILSVPGYCIISFHRKVSENSRYFGGSMLLIKKGIRKGIKVFDSLDGDKIWIRLKKDFFRFEKDIL